MNVILADEMGLGKTLTVITAIAALQEGVGLTASLVVAPQSVLATWTAELKHHTPGMLFVLYNGDKAERAEAWIHRL